MCGFHSARRGRFRGSPHVSPEPLFSGFQFGSRRTCLGISPFKCLWLNKWV
ncbi:hypothetical protein HanXRQr2_Chr10g0442241 [Helianthus annuus]|uniref:Uncharacterized protein n=1 Tax=Helianthus annuus TaxID=4232 RepID=A0A9K3N4K2_HELAN|nr:hypothetical protein HanXRQr2_Chr10g0442241 [Helianthus annuus]